MGGRGFDAGPAQGAARTGACAIAPVRGDVTTARAAAALRRRRGEGDGRVRPAAAAPDAFPCRLLDVGPA